LSALAGVFGTVGARNDDSGTILKSARRIELGYETFGLAYIQLFFSLSRFEQ
jgi:hypothetical protein